MAYQLQTFNTIFIFI